MTSRKTKPKMYTVRYHIMAKSLMEARKKAKASDPDEIYLNPEWEQKGHLADAIGFVETQEETDEYEAEV